MVFFFCEFFHYFLLLIKVQLILNLFNSIRPETSEELGD